MEAQSGICRSDSGAVCERGASDAGQVSQPNVTPPPVGGASVTMLSPADLLQAAFLGDMDAVRRLTHQDFSRNPSTSFLHGSKSSALVEACSMGHLSIAEYLIGEGLDVNERNGSGVTPLWAAAGRECPRIIKVLLDGGANPCLSDLHGNTPLMRAAWGAKTEVVRCLLQSPDTGVDLMNQDGCTALWFAAFYGRVSILKLLLSAGADWNVGKDPYAVAVSQGRHCIRVHLEEAEQRYTLHRARLLCDAGTLMRCSCELPACLASLVGSRGQIPAVVMAGGEGEGGVGQGQQGQHRGRKRRREVERWRQVVHHVVTELKPELFVELDQMLGWW